GMMIPAPVRGEDDDIAGAKELETPRCAEELVGALAKDTAIVVLVLRRAALPVDQRTGLSPDPHRIDAAPVYMHGHFQAAVASLVQIFLLTSPQAVRLGRLDDRIPKRTIGGAEHRLDSRERESVPTQQ